MHRILGKHGMNRLPANQNWVPDMRPFRRDARFQTFAASLGLMDFWLRYGPPDDCELRDGKLICI